MLGEGKVEIVERPRPTAQDDWAVVRIRASAICEDERDAFLNGAKYNFGHEACGEVVEIDSPRRVKVGDRVVPYAVIFCGSCPECMSGRAIMCRNIQSHDGYHAEYVALPERCLLPLPDDVAYDVGALIGDTLGTPYRAIKRLGVNGAHLVAIFGLDPIGLSAVLLCKWKGARVLAFDVSRTRMELGRELGADALVDASHGDLVRAIIETTEGEGADIAIDCTGDSSSQSAAIECTKTGGKIALVRETSEAAPVFSSDLLVRKELTVLGSRYFALNDYPEMVQLVESGLPLSRLITHRFPLASAKEAFDLFFSAQTGKVLFDL
jgi:propanol-preferring alcohol dehydrogenase